MIHYHGTPITPNEVLKNAMRGRHFCVSYIRPDQVMLCKTIGQSIMYDNGAFSAWRTGKKLDWNSYYDFLWEHLNSNIDWAVIPDVIDGSEEQNDTLMRQCPLSKDISAPVWHLHESYKRLHSIAYLGYKRICFGSSGAYARVGDYEWLKRVENAFNLLCPNGGEPPVAVHMLRGMSLAGSNFPFASADSTNIARNHNRCETMYEIYDMVNRIDGANCPRGWKPTVNIGDSFDKDVCKYDLLTEQGE